MLVLDLSYWPWDKSLITPPQFSGIGSGDKQGGPDFCKSREACISFTRPCIMYIHTKTVYKRLFSPIKTTVNRSDIRTKMWLLTNKQSYIHTKLTNCLQTNNHTHIQRLCTHLFSPMGKKSIQGFPYCRPRNGDRSNRNWWLFFPRTSLASNNKIDIVILKLYCCLKLYVVHKILFII